MDDDGSTEATFSFRLLRLTQKAVDELCKLFSAATKPTVRGRIDGFVVSFDISEGMDLEPFYSFLEREALNPSTYSVWISVVTEKDHSGVSLPEHVLRVIRRTKCGLDFSFVACLGDSVEL